MARKQTCWLCWKQSRVIFISLFWLIFWSTTLAAETSQCTTDLQWTRCSAPWPKSSRLLPQFQYLPLSGWEILPSNLMNQQKTNIRAVLSTQKYTTWALQSILIFDRKRNYLKQQATWHKLMEKRTLYLKVCISAIP